MSAPRWKPGDVGISATDERFIVTSRGGCFWPGDADTATVGVSGVPEERDRPLVVIDPEDRERVERLFKAFDDEVEGASGFATDLQAALRSLVADPKPDEPQGLGAVVEDADGVRHVRAGLTHDGRMEDCWRQLSGDRVGYWSRWADINVVRVLSEGWSE